MFIKHLKSIYNYNNRNYNEKKEADDENETETETEQEVVIAKEETEKEINSVDLSKNKVEKVGRPPLNLNFNLNLIQFIKTCE